MKTDKILDIFTYILIISIMIYFWKITLILIEILGFLSLIFIGIVYKKYKNF